MLHDDSLQQLWSDASVPHAVGIHDDNRAARADTQTRGLASLDSLRTEEKTFALEERG
jgi:hypothetical protein